MAWLGDEPLRADDDWKRRSFRVRLAPMSSTNWPPEPGTEVRLYWGTEGHIISRVIGVEEVPPRKDAER